MFFSFETATLGKKVSMFVIRNGTVVSSSTIDDTIGAVYDVKFVKTASGSELLFVSNYEHTAPGSVFVYSGVGFKSRKTIASFQNLQKAMGSGAPGWLFPHYPTVSSTATAPNVLVCGDGAENLTNLQYQQGLNWTVAFQKGYKSTIGDAVVGDFDGNGYTDVIVSDYDAGFLHLFTYQ